MAAADDLPPLREVIRKHDLDREEVARPEFPARSQSHRQHCARRGSARGRHRDRDRTRPRRADARTASQGARAGDRGRARSRARSRRCRRLRRTIPAGSIVIEGDALRFRSLARYLGRRARSRIVANLPYNIATVLLTGWLETEPWPPFYDRLVLMFQREVAERIVAQPDSKAYGRLSVLAQWRTQPKILFDIAPSAFVPPPKVTSSRGRNSSRAPCPTLVTRALERVAEAAFGQRRKMLRQSLARGPPSDFRLWRSILRRCPKAASATRTSARRSQGRGRARYQHDHARR